ncbi:MAG: hypothetical protein SOW59_05640 [Corynebacterium sp.]|nr:hypothetical protein [Corynebacterium sp.]
MRVIKGTDLAVAHIHEPAPIRRLLPLSTTRIALPTDTITAGFGGDLFAPQPKHGKILALPPYGISRDLRTRVKPAILIYNSVPAIKGDSGAPVIIRRQSTNQDTDQWEITATQSLIVDPLGINLKLATAAALAPHTSAIRQAGHFLLKDQAREE